MLLAPEATKIGHYELLFYVDEYFAGQGAKLPAPAFIEKVPVRFAVFDITQHFHVPMLATPWSCATYRGS
jgi:5-hydroxyisourate hydrolase